MQVNSIQSSQQGFGAKFVMNSHFKDMIQASSNIKLFDAETQKLAKEFAQKNPECELSVDKFEKRFLNDGSALYDIEVSNTKKVTSREWTFHGDKETELFPLKSFLKNLLDANKLYTYRAGYDSVIHDLLGGRELNVLYKK